MKQNLKTTVTIFSMLLCFSVFAQGHSGGGGRGGRGGGKGQDRGSKPDASEILSTLDTNKDEVIDKDEAANDKRGKISEDFDTIDANEDSFIDLEELKVSLYAQNLKTPYPISSKRVLNHLKY